jgi:hypothetical protein
MLRVAQTSLAHAPDLMLWTPTLQARHARCMGILVVLTAPTRDSCSTVRTVIICSMWICGARNVTIRKLLVRQDWVRTGNLSVAPDVSDAEAKAERFRRK